MRKDKNIPNSKKSGTLIIIGGHEDKEGECTILRQVVKLIHNRRLALATIASQEPEDYYYEYQDCFEKLGIKDLKHLYITKRAESTDAENLRMLDDIEGIFFSGGDQLRICSQIGDTPFETRILEIYNNGGVIAGTSAGASVMGEIMLVSGEDEKSNRIDNLHLASGLRLLNDVIIDQHFAERGRIGRLLGAVALNPRILGIGIDENTAIIVHERKFRVIGSGAVYVIDGAGVTYSNIAEGEKKRILSISDIRLHILSSGDGFNLDTRRPRSSIHIEESHKLDEYYIEPRRKRASSKTPR